MCLDDLSSLRKQKKKNIYIIIFSFIWNNKIFIRYTQNRNKNARLLFFLEYVSQYSDRPIKRETVEKRWGSFDILTYHKGERTKIRENRIQRKSEGISSHTKLKAEWNFRKLRSTTSCSRHVLSYHARGLKKPGRTMRMYQTKSF